MFVFLQLNQKIRKNTRLEPTKRHWKPDHGARVLETTTLADNRNGRCRTTILINAVKNGLFLWIFTIIIKLINNNYGNK